MLKVHAAPLYCVADSAWYDAPDRISDPGTRYRLPGGVPDGWREAGNGLWMSVAPDGVTVPEQGWKIHVSAVPDTAEAVLAATAAACARHRVAFKYLRSRDALLLATGKHMPRASSGKFVAVYPGAEQFADVLADLRAALDGQPGPYILSDLRIGPGPLYVRYGGFTELRCPGPDGSPVPALRNPSGSLVPDEREPVFRSPAWAPVPDVLAPHLAARAAARAPGFPYLIRRALHFSNSGGVYLAEHAASGEQVVLREARPHAALDPDGRTAVDRLHREHEMLRRLAGLPCVPRVHGMAVAWEHHFLVEEYIAGERLLDSIIGRYPLRERDPAPEVVAEYLSWVAGITSQLSAALDAMHARGLAFGDLHPANVMIRPDGSVVLVDFEFCAELGDDSAVRVAAPGFAAPALAGAAADRHALRAVWLFMLLPMADAAAHDPGKRATLEAVARARWALPADAGPPTARPPTARPPTAGPPAAGPPAAGRRRERAPSGEDTVAELLGAGQPDWAALRAAIAAGISASATPDRADRLFPADPAVFESGGHTLAYGAAGVLLALHRAGAGLPPGSAGWLAESAWRSGPGDYRGLFDGLYGAAVALHEIGHEQEARDVLGRARRARPPVTAGLFSGLAGTGLAQCHFAGLTGDDGLLDEAVRTAGALDGLARGDEPGDLIPPPSAGLLHGMAGIALLHLRLYRMTGDGRHLAAARRALHRDAGVAVAMPDGTCQLREGHRRLLYLDGGSAGLALAAQEYLACAADPVLADLIPGVVRGCENEFVREPGLLRGRSGLLGALALLGGRPDQVLAQVRRLAWHAVYRDGGVHLPGMTLMRLSTDLATGSAGMLLALHAALGPGDTLLPLLPPGRRHPGLPGSAPAGT